MVKFLSLYLGLLTGVQPVEVVVGAEVASVEFFLDGESLGVVRSEPWRLKADFGQRLLPRYLEAVARDEHGREIGRTEQFLNLPRPASEAGIVLDRDQQGKVTSARVTWQSVSRSRPLRARATFDGKPLTVTDPKRIPIPDHNSKHLHILVVELEFSTRDQAQAVASFGGSHLSEVSTELTAIPVVATSRRWPSVEDLQGSIWNNGQPVPIISLDDGQGDILFVRDIGAGKIIEALGREARGLGGQGVGSATGIGSADAIVASPVASSAEQLREMLELDGDIRVRLMWPATKRVERDQVSMDLFPASPAAKASDGGVFWALTQDVMLDGTSDLQRLTDAVAVAGLEAVSENRRRAVVLVLGPDAPDHRLYEPVMVREYLKALGVPLYVWAVGVQKKADVYPEWGQVDVISSLSELRRKVRDVEKDLERQKILWVGGRHLPQDLEFAVGAAIRPSTR